MPPSCGRSTTSNFDEHGSDQTMPNESSISSSVVAFNSMDIEEPSHSALREKFYIPPQGHFHEVGAPIPMEPYSSDAVVPSSEVVESSMECSSSSELSQPPSADFLHQYGGMKSSTQPSLTHPNPLMQMSASAKFTDPRFFADHPWREYIYIISTLLSQIFTQAASNSTLPLLHILAQHFHSDSAERTWFMSSFSLAQGTLILMSGRIGDIYGLRKAVLGGYCWTIMWSILAGVSSYAKTATFFIVCRAMIGAGLAFVLPNAMGAAGRIYRPGTRRKNMVFSLIGLSAPLGGSSAPIITGWIGLKCSHWEWAFYHYGIAATVALALAWYSVPVITPHRVEDPAASVDWIGCTLGVAGLVLFSFVWNQAPIVGWNTSYIIALIIISVAVLMVFFWYETHVPNNPLLPRQILRDPIMMLTLMVLLLSWGSFGILFYRFFVFIQDLRHYNPLQSGLSVWPTIPSGMTAAIVCGWLISRISAQFLLVFAMAVFMCSDIMLLMMPVDQTYWRMSFGMWVFSVWGMDWSFPAGSIILSDELPPHLQGMAGSLLTTMVMYGQSLFVGISGTIESHVLKRHPKDILAAHRGCCYFAIGISSLALFISIFVAMLTLRRKNECHIVEKWQNSE